MTYRHIPAEIIKKRGVSVKKRILSILLAVLMLLSALPLGMVDTAYAAALASGKCGDSAKWTLDAAGTLTISGTGRMTNFTSDRPASISYIREHGEIAYAEEMSRRKCQTIKRK